MRACSTVSPPLIASPARTKVHLEHQYHRCTGQPPPTHYTSGFRFLRTRPSERDKGGERTFPSRPQRPGSSRHFLGPAGAVRGSGGPGSPVAPPRRRPRPAGDGGAAAGRALEEEAGTRSRAAAVGSRTLTCHRARHTQQNTPDPKTAPAPSPPRAPQPLAAPAGGGRAAAGHRPARARSGHRHCTFGAHS